MTGDRSEDIRTSNERNKRKAGDFEKNKAVLLEKQPCKVSAEGDSEPPVPHEYDSLANCWFQPPTHPSLSY